MSASVAGSFEPGEGLSADGGTRLPLRQACPVCETPADRCRPEGVGFLRCPSCGLYFRQDINVPAPAEGWEVEFYGDPEILALYRRRRDAFERIEEMMAAYLDGRRGRVLDVGAGIGVFVDVLRSRGWQPQGIEAAPTAARIARETLDPGCVVVEGDFLACDLPGDNQAVTFLDVLRHLPDPMTTLRRAFDLLSPGGCIVLREKSPFLHGAERRHVRSEGARASDPLQHWSQRAVTTMLRRAGFEDMRVQPSPLFGALGQQRPLARVLRQAYRIAGDGAYRLTGQVMTHHYIAFGRRPRAA